MSRQKKISYALLLILGLFSISFIWLGEQSYVYRITREDGIIENITALFYLFGFITGLYVIFKYKPKRLLLPILWTVLCLIFLGEETSWFQRFLNYSVPAVENVNAQSEFNFHNLAIFKGDDLFVDGKLSKQGILNFLKSTQNIFRLGFFSYFVAIPLLMMVARRFRKFATKLGYIRPHNYFVFIILLIFGCSFVFAIISPTDKKMALAETREMLYAFFIFAYIWIYIKDTRFNFSAQPITPLAKESVREVN